MQKYLVERMLMILEERGISERQMSMDLGYSDSYLNKAKNGSRRLALNFLDKFCKELELTPEEFFANPEINTTAKHKLMQEVEGLTNADILHLCDCAEYLKSKNQQISKRK